MCQPSLHPSFTFGVAWGPDPGVQHFRVLDSDVAEPQTGVVTGAALASLGQGRTPCLVEDSGAAWCIVLSLIKSSLCWEGRLLSVQPFPEAPIHNTVGVPRTLLTELLRICEQLESQALFGNDCWPSPAFSSTCLSCCQPLLHLRPGVASSFP